MRRRVRASTPPAAAPAAIGPSTKTSEFEVEVTRAIDQELEWYFSYAENAKRLGSVSLLPMLEATRLVVTDDDSELATQRRGLELATAVQATIGAVSPHHAGVLRAVYTPRSWPASIVREFGCLGAIVVRLTVATNPWPARTNHDGLETAAAHHLARLLAEESTRPAALRKTARRLMASAIAAYVRTRCKGACPIA